MVGAVVVGMASILARVKDAPLHVLFFFSLTAVVLYAIGWAAVQRFAKQGNSPDADSVVRELSLPLPERARRLAKELTAFIEAHPRPDLAGITDLAEVSRLSAPSVEAIHFGY